MGVSNVYAHGRSGFAIAVCSLALLASSGCDSSTQSRGISSGLFLAPITAGSSIAKIAAKLDYLRAIRPGSLDSDLVDVPTDPFVLGRLSIRDGAAVTKTDEILVYENQSRSLLSSNLCPAGGAAGTCGEVKLCYNSDGIDNIEQSQGSVSSRGKLLPTVPSLQLKNGWILAFEGVSNNLVAFRKEAPRDVLIDDVMTRLEFRGFTFEQGTATKNFGQGNGLVLSLVISGDEMKRALSLSADAEPIVTRIFELEENKILLTFSTVRAIHMLELREEELVLPWDRNDVDHPDKLLPVKVLKGKVKLFRSNPNLPALPEVLPFLSYSEISKNFTGNPTVKVDSFQPILIPDTGAALFFEQTTSNFLRVGASRMNVPDTANPGQTKIEIVGAAVGIAVASADVFRVLQAGSGGDLVSPPLNFDASFYNVRNPEILMIEEKTNNVLAYDYTKAPGSNLKVFIDATNILLRRTADGRVSGIISAEPFLVAAVKDVNDNRLAFDKGFGQIVSVSYSSGVLVIVATLEALTAVTGSTITNISYIEPLNNSEVRAFDSQTNSLLKIDLDYAAFPISIE